MPPNIKDQIEHHYGNRIRVRACGVLVKDGRLLMLKHDGIGKNGYFWNVPGGGAELDENLENAVEREFMEETGLKVRVGQLLCFHQFIEAPLHALEYYFEVKHLEGTLKLGHDPEEVAILSDVKWFTKEDFLNLHKESRPDFLLNLLNFD